MSQDHPQSVVYSSFCPGARFILGFLLLAGLAFTGRAQDTLLQAVKRGDVALVKEIVANDPEQVNLRNKEGESPLHWAALKGYRDIAVILLGKGAKVHYTDKQLGGTALHWAAVKGHHDLVELLLDRGADVNATTRDDWTPLHIAAYQGHREVVELLLERKANLHARDKDGLTPLQASIENRRDLLELMLDKGGRETPKSVKESGKQPGAAAEPATPEETAALTNRAAKLEHSLREKEAALKVKEAALTDIQKRLSAAETLVADLTDKTKSADALQDRLERETKVAGEIQAKATEEEKNRQAAERKIAELQAAHREETLAIKGTLASREMEIAELKAAQARQRETAEPAGSRETALRVAAGKARDQADQEWAVKLKTREGEFEDLKRLIQLLDKRNQELASGAGASPTNNEIAEAKARIAELEKQLQLSQNLNEKAWADERTALKRRIDELTAAAGAADRQKTAAASGKGVEDLKRKMEGEWETRLKAREDEVAAVKQQMQTMEKRSQELSAKAEEAEKFKQDLQDTRAVLRTEKEKTAQLDGDLKAVRQRLNEDRKAADDTIATLKVKAAEIEERNKTLAGASEPLKKELEQARQAQERLTVIQRDLAEKDKALQEAKARIVEMEEQTPLTPDLNEKAGEDERVALKQKAQAADKLSQELSAKAEEVEKLKQDLQETRAVLRKAIRQRLDDERKTPGDATTKKVTVAETGEKSKTLAGTNEPSGKELEQARQAQERLTVIQHDLAEKDKALQEAKARIAELEKQTRLARDLNEKAWADERAALKRSIEELTAAAEETDRRTKSSEKEMGDLKAAREQLQRGLAASLKSEKETSDKIREDLSGRVKEQESLRDELGKTKKTAEESRSRALALEAELKSVRQQADDMAKFKDEAFSLRGHATELEGQLQVLRREKEQLQSGVNGALKSGQEAKDSMRKEAERAATMEKELAELRSRLTAAEKVRKERESLLKSLESKLDEVDILKQTAAASAARVKTLEGAEKQLKEALDSRDGLQSKIVAHENLLKTLLAEKELLQKEVQDRKTALDRMQDKLEQSRNAEQELVDRRKNADELRKENDRLKGQVAASQAEAKSVSTQLETLRNQSGAETAGLKEKVQALESQVETAKVGMFDQAKVIDLLRAKLKARAGSSADSVEPAPKTEKGKAKGAASAAPAIVAAARPAPEEAAASLAGPDPQKGGAAGPLSALFAAVASGSIEDVRKTIGENPAQVKAKRENGETPLHVAAENGRKDIVELLLDAGADAQARDGITGFTPLHEAAYNNHQSVVELLLQKGADVNATSDIGTPLHLAVSLGNTDLVRFLLKRGADINAKSDLGTPLHIAVFNGDRKMADLLRKNGGKE